MVSPFIPYLYIFGTVIFTVYSQLIIKWRIVQYGHLPDDLYGKIIFLFKAALDPFIFSGFLSVCIAGLFWMAAMTKFELSYAYPYITAGLTLLTVFLAIVILGETINISKIIGVLLIVIGVVMMSINA